MSRLVTITIAVLSLATLANGQTPVVVNHYVPVYNQDFNLVSTGDYQDIPNSELVVDIPSGLAVITWSANPQEAGVCQIRPVIGNDLPSKGLWFASTPDGSLSGTWVIQTQGGILPITLEVKLATGHAMRFFSGSSLSWTLTVYPAAPATVPALSSFGLGLLLVGIIGIGSCVFRKKKPLVVAICFGGLVFSTQPVLAGSVIVTLSGQTTEAVPIDFKGDTISGIPNFPSAQLYSIGVGESALSVRNGLINEEGNLAFNMSYQRTRLSGKPAIRVERSDFPIQTWLQVSSGVNILIEPGVPITVSGITFEAFIVGDPVPSAASGTVPTISTWGIAIMAMLLTIVGTMIFKSMNRKVVPKGRI